jgi:hypothetical protein
MRPYVQCYRICGKSSVCAVCARGCRPLLVIRIWGGRIYILGLQDKSQASSSHRQSSLHVYGGIGDLAGNKLKRNELEEWEGKKEKNKRNREEVIKEIR